MKIRHILLAATLLAGGVGGAVAQGVMNNGATYDSAQLPAIQGKVAEYSLTPRGDVDGLILADGTEVHTAAASRHATRLCGEAWGRCHDPRPEAHAPLSMVQAMSVKNDATGSDRDGHRRRAARPVRVARSRR